jgi:antibiotic biosynthesis monooxygenase (ABM) superfamily enzyme
VISAQFIFKPGTYDDEFHRLDAEIEAYVATIPGFLGAEKWVSFDGQTKNSMYYFETMDAMFQLSRFDAHREAKGNLTVAGERRLGTPTRYPSKVQLGIG